MATKFIDQHCEPLIGLMQQTDVKSKEAEAKK